MVKIKKKDIPKYTSDDLKEALKAVNNGHPIRLVSKQFNIPKSTLFDKKKGVSKPVISKRGPPSVLGEENEQRLLGWIFYMCDLGFPVTRQQLVDSVQRLLQKMNENTVFTDNRPGKHWFDAFRKRHPELRERLSQNMLSMRAAVTEDRIRGWFEKVRDYLTSKDLLDIEPSRIFNCDESGFHLCPQGQRVLARRGDRATYNFVQNDEKEALTALFCGNAAGQLLPPMIMFNYVRIPASISLLMPKEWPIGRSETGWMTAASFYEWVANFFYKWLITNKIQLPVVLYLDGHTSHLTLELSDFCREKGIELVALLPQSTHMTQPMDVGVFHPVKAAWKKAVPEWRLKNGGAKLKREHFGGILESVIDGLQWKKLLPSGFRATGLYPFNPDALDYENLRKKSLEPNSNPQTSMMQSDLSISNHLDYIEQSMNSQLLEAFRLVADEDEWTGDISQLGLFQFWRQVKAAAQRQDTKQSSADDCNEQEIILEEIPDERTRSPLAERNCPSTDNDNVGISGSSASSDDILEAVNYALEEGLIFHVDDTGELVPLDELTKRNCDTHDSSHSSGKELNNNDEAHVNANNKWEHPSNAEQNSTAEAFASELEETKERPAKFEDSNKNEVTNEPSSYSCHEKDGASSVEQFCSEKDIKKGEDLPTYTAPDSQSSINDSSAGAPTKSECPLPSMPSPFKQALFWPSAPKKPLKKTRAKEQLPSAITSDDWNLYHKNKREKEQKEKEERELRKQERLRKRELKNQEKEAAKLARILKKEKAEQLRKPRSPNKRSPTVLAKRRGRKRKVESRIKNERVEISKEIKQELIDCVLHDEDKKETDSPPCKMLPK